MQTPKRKDRRKKKMPHEDAGHYGAKHPGGQIDPQIAEAVAAKEKEGRITCAAAHAIAKKLAVPPQVVGMHIDLLEKKISRCQMGLFGYDRKTTKEVKAAGRVPQKLEKAIREVLVGDRITCIAAWEMAQKMGHSKLEIASACEALELKINKCQLGAF
jgi:hypothetical protein